MSVVVVGERADFSASSDVEFKSVGEVSVGEATEEAATMEAHAPTALGPAGPAATAPVDAAALAVTAEGDVVPASKANILPMEVPALLYL